MHATNDDVPTTVPDGMNGGEPSPFLIPNELLPLFMDNGVFVPDLWWWGFDMFLIKLVGIVAAKFINDGHGYPCRHPAPGADECRCETEWRIYMEDIRDDIAGYDKFASTATAEQYAKVQDAMRRLIDRLGNWWD